jgi:hypothetical protein
MCRTLLTRRVLARLLAQPRQPAVLLVGAAGDVDLAQAADRLAQKQAVAVDPQQLAQSGGASSIGLALLAGVGLDQDHPVAAVVSQQADQPVVEAADLEHGHERLAVPQPLAGQLLEEGVDLLRLRRHLPGPHDVALVVAERDRDLAGVLIDAEV